MNTSLAESSRFPMLYVSMQSSSSSTITFFPEELLFFNETVIFLKEILDKSKKSESVNVISSTLFRICFFGSVKKITTKANQVR